MAKIYIKPETKTFKVELQQIMAGTITQDIKNGSATEWGAKENNFDFFAAPEVEEETPNKNKLNQEEEWDEFEEEE